MFEKLADIKKRYDELNDILINHKYDDLAVYVNGTKELCSLQPIIDEYNNYLKYSHECESADIQFNTEKDASMRELWREEFLKLKDLMHESESKLKVLLLPKDENDTKNVILEIRAGVGGDESSLFAADLLRMYKMFCDKNNFIFEILNIEQTSVGGIKEAQAQIKGKNVYANFKYESGVHRVQRIPETESQGRVHTSAVTVAVLPEMEYTDVKIDDKDIRIDLFRSNGAGGQHINKTESAIRITHFPTGIVVTCQNERSQIRNKEKALEVLKSKLYLLEVEKQNEKINGIRGEQLSNGWGSAKRSYVMCPYTLVKDNDSGYESSNVEAILDGEINDMIEAGLKN